jgi:hypothetical protein
MVSNKNILISLINVLLLKLTQLANCPKYKCNDLLSDDSCSVVNPVLNGVNFDYYNIEVKFCGGSKYCSIPDMTTWSKTDKSTFKCAEKYYYPLVDHEKCESNSNCGSGLCRDGRCLGKDFNSTCSASNECVVGAYCDGYMKKCLPQKTENQTCNSSEECVNMAGCYNKTCTRYWSLNEGTTILSNASPELYCSTGFAYEGKCAFLIIRETLPYQCNDTCRYLIRYNNKEIEMPSLCTCGYNTDGIKYCQLGSDSVVFRKYIELFKTNLEQPCHVSKKGYCSNEINYMDLINRQNYYNAWKGKYQLTDSCLSNFYSHANYLNLSISLVFLFLIHLN